jgi:hypothetical protein
MDVYMGGTEGTGKYYVLAETPLGRIGVRDLGDSVRIRVEPSAEGRKSLTSSLLSDNGWKQPGDNGQDRFSTVKAKHFQAPAALHGALNAIGAYEKEGEWNPTAGHWAEVNGFTSVVAAPEVSVTTQELDQAFDIEGSDPAKLRAEACLLREEAEQLRKKVAEDATKAVECESRAKACEHRARAIERALAEFENARQRVTDLGVASVTEHSAARKRLMRLTKKALLDIAEQLSLEAPKGAKKAELVDLIVD